MVSDPEDSELVAQAMSDQEGPLDPLELADAAVSAALVFSLMAIGRLLGLGLYFQLLATVVFATLATRRRFRASAMSTASAAVMGLLLGGVNPIMTTIVAGIFGWAGGVGIRKRWSRWRTITFGAVVGWPIVSGATVGLLLLFADLRQLTLDNIGNQWRGNARIFSAIGLDGAADWGSRAVDWSIEYWWIATPVVQLLISFAYSLFVWRVGRVVSGRVNRVLGPSRRSPLPAISNRPSSGRKTKKSRSGSGGSGPTLPSAAPQPVPLRVEGSTLTHRSGAILLENATFDLNPGEFVALAGPNGVGKTTLLRALSGQEPLAGLHQGVAGLGRRHGTAYIGQRPETQVLGLRVLDDLRWGLYGQTANDASDADSGNHADGAGATPHPDEIAEVLDRVGLAGFEDRYTSDLSGGELQRLALAGTLLRKPQLLLSDESTAMLDPEGRELVVNILREAARDGATVLHATHHESELAAADRVITLGREAVTSSSASPPESSAASGAPGSAELGPEADAGAEAPRQPIRKFAPPVSDRVREVEAMLRRKAEELGQAAAAIAGSDPTGVASPTSPAPTPPSPAPPAFTKPPGPVAIRLTDVGFTHAFNSPWAHESLKNISLEVRFGELVLVTGPNGSGKTTLARVIAGMEEATAGTVERVGGANPGFAFQHARLQLLRATAGVELKALAGPDAEPGVAEQWLSRLGLSPTLVADRRIDALSGGQQRRVLLAGLLGRGCNVLVLDEPLAGLDADGTDRLLEAVDEMLARNVAVVVVSHDPGWGRDKADHVVRLDAGRLVSNPEAMAIATPYPGFGSSGVEQ